MMFLIRRVLILSVLMAVYAAAVPLAHVNYGWLVLVILMALVLARRTRRQLAAYGTARWASADELREMVGGTGLILGFAELFVSRWEGLKALFSRRLSADRAVRMFLQSCQRRQKPSLIRLNKAVHTAVFAPTGAGKGVSLVIPFLLTCRESCVVVDFKGENYRLTADARRRMGQRVICLDPFGQVGGRDTFNPLDFIDRTADTALDDVRALAEALVIRTGSEKEPHWNDAAEIWIAAMIAAAVAKSDECNLQFVREILTNPVRMRAAIEVMCASDDWNGMLARMGHQLGHFQDKELSSTLTTVNRHMRFLDTIPTQKGTLSSTFSPAELLNGRTTVYLVLPPDHQRTQSPLLRLWINALLRAVVKGGLSQRRVHYVLDEAASLGHMDALDDAVDKYRGYGVRLQFYYQSIGQLKKCWPEGQDQTLLSNVTQIFMAVNDQQTAEYVSNRLGEFTQVVSSGGSGRGGSRQTSSSQQGSNTSHSQSWNENDNWSQAARKLLKPEEVLAMDQMFAITFVSGMAPIGTWACRYYEGIPSTEIGVIRVLIDSACLFALALLFAVIATAAYFPDVMR